MKWTMAARAEKMNPSVIREILKVTEKPGIISFAGGFPDSAMFDVEGIRAASQKALAEDPGVGVLTIAQPPLLACSVQHVVHASSRHYPTVISQPFHPPRLA